MILKWNLRFDYNHSAFEISCISFSAFAWNFVCARLQFTWKFNLKLCLRWWIKYASEEEVHESVFFDLHTEERCVFIHKLSLNRFQLESTDMIAYQWSLRLLRIRTRQMDVHLNSRYVSHFIQLFSVFSGYFWSATKQNKNFWNWELGRLYGAWDMQSGLHKTTQLSIRVYRPSEESVILGS